MSVICRIFNVYGSLARDWNEKNLNSMFFPEFKPAREGRSDDALKSWLAAVCAYERTCLTNALDALLRAAQSQLGDARGKRIHEVVRLFYNAIEIYTEVYELRDLSTPQN